MGGLSRRAFQITTLTDKESPPALLLDAGNLLFKRPTVAHSQELSTARGLMAIYQQMRYDAVAVGPNDLAAGREFLNNNGPEDFPWLSANLRDKNDAPIFPASRIVERGGMRVGILGITGQLAAASLETHVVDWRSVLPEQLDRLAKECHLVIVLSSLPAGDNAEIAEKYREAHVLIAAGQQGGTLPRVANGTLVTQTLSQGKNLGVLDLDWLPGSSWGMDRAEQRSELQKRSSFTSAVIPLTKNLPEDPQVAAHIQVIKKQRSADNQAAAAPDPRHNPAGSRAEAGLAGFTRCQECHQAQSRYWQTTRHAGSYSTLRQQQQNFNIDCLPCHATQISLARPVEALLTAPADLQAVGCEVCHGLGLAHAAAPESVKPQGRVNEETCISCHTKERDPLFDYRNKLPKVSCPAE